MKKILVILSFVIIGLFFLFSEAGYQGKEESKKKFHELKCQSKTIDPIKEMIWERKYRRKVSTNRSFSSANSTNNNTHRLTEVGVWGYGPCDNVYVDGNRAYMGSGRYLLVMDISDKTKPVKIGEIMLNNHIHWLTVSGSHAYIANDTSGLRIIDVSDINNIQEVGYYDTPGCSRGIFVSGTHAYMADQEAGLRIIDISTPSSPQEVGFYDTPGWSFSVFVSGGYAYVGDLDSGLRIIDVTNPVSPQEVGFYKTPTNSLGVFVSGNYAYVACGAGAGLRVFDVSNPSSPQEVGF